MLVEDKSKRRELVVLYWYPFFCFALSHLFNLNTLAAVIIFYAAPSCYLSLRIKKHLGKPLLFAALAGVPFIIIIDHIANVNQEWVVPYSLLDFRFFKYVAFEVILWAVFNVYFVIIFYEYFIENKIKKVHTSRTNYFTVAVLAFFTLFVMCYFYTPQLFHIPYFYLWWGIILLLIPTVIRLYFRPDLLLDYLQVAAYFFVVTFVSEITALQLGWWYFPETPFIGWISIGELRFPIEELLFWILCFGMAMLSHYEFFYEEIPPS